MLCPPHAMHAIRRMLSGHGFKHVICPQHIKTVWLRTDGQVETTIVRALVFLKAPPPGAMRDVVARVPKPDAVMYESPDARGLERKASGNAAFVYWTPRTAVVPYALYDHQLRWTTPGPTRDPAIYTDLHCEVRTGVLGLEIVTPATFEAAVVFKHSGRNPGTEEQLLKHALKQLQSGGVKPTLTENGSRLEWKIAGPRVGDRYVCVAFHEGGVALWQKRLAAKSFTAKLRRLVGLQAR